MIRKFIYTVLIVFVVLIGAIAIGLQTERVQHWIDVEIKYQVRERTGWNISYSELSWEFPFRFTFTDILLDDRKGTRINIEKASGTVNPVALIRQYILIHDLDITYDEWNIIGTIRGNPRTQAFAATLTTTSENDPNFLLLVKTRFKNLNGSLELTSKWRDLDGHLEGKISWDGNAFKYSDITGRIEDYDLKGNIIVDKKLHFDGTELTLIHPDGNGSFILSGTLDSLKAAFELNIPGYKEIAQIHFKGDLFHRQNKIESQFNASFSYGDRRYFTDTNLNWSPNSPLRFRTNGRDDKGMLFDTDLTEDKELKKYHLIVNMEKSEFFKELHLKALIPVDNLYEWDYTLFSKGDGYEADFEGHAQLGIDKQIIEVAKMRGKWKEYALALEDPFKLEHNYNEIKLTPLFMRLDDGTVYTTFDYVGDNVHIAGRLVDLPLKMLPLVDEGFAGKTTFNGNFFLFGPVNHLGGQAQLELPKIVFNEHSLSHMPALEGKIDANLMDDKLELKGYFSGISTTPISIDATIPMIVSLDPLLVDVHVDKPFTTKLNYNGPVGPITELITVETAPLKGDLTLEVELAGTLNKPEVNGHGTFRNGSYESIDTGVVYNDIQADFNAVGDHIDITGIRSSDGEGRIVTGTGTFNTNIEKKFPFEFNLDLEDARLVRIDWMKGNGTGKINFAGNFDRAKLSGHIETTALKVSIPERRSANIKVIPVTYINQSPDEPPPTVITKPPISWPIDLDVQIDTKGGVITGDDFNSNWRGKILVKGNLQDPILEGNVRIIDGSYMFNGRPFEITQGSITFDGDPLKGTNLYVVAEQDLGEITAEVVLKGTLNNPELALHSKPPLPQREVLSWILFGRGTSEINSIEKQELTKSIADLNTGGKQDVLTRIRRQIGIDRIDINRDMTGETNEMSIQVGKYISKGVLVSVNKNINNDANRIGVEAKLTHNIKVEAEVGDNAEGHLFLKWKRDY